MSIPPTARAVGKAVTLRLRDGRQIHGTLQAAEPPLYRLQMNSTHTVRAFDRRDVDTLVVHEWIRRP